MNNDRRIESKRFREDAAQAAFNRDHPDHLANGDEERLASANYAMSFTKGLDHCDTTGLIVDKNHFEAFRQAIDNGVIEPFTTRVPVPQDSSDDQLPRRQWEAPTAGLVFDLEGPDAQAVTMPPAPPLCSDELTFEMAEVYELALVRDVPFEQFDAHGSAPGLTASIERLNDMDYIQHAIECCEFEGRPRKVGADGKLNQQTIFRGFSPGSDEGPYVSSFLLMGNPDRTGTFGTLDGRISFGAQTIDQRVPMAPVGDDYMIDFGDWLQVQQGFNVNAANGTQGGQALAGQTRRFIHTPRDLATYVHFDALYQAYLNACLILLANGTAFDPAFDNLSGSSGFSVLTNAATGDMKATNAGGFALYGGPHILTLVTEVATRALKAVRYQKFNVHIRLRPETLSGRLEKACQIEERFPNVCGAFSKTLADLQPTADAIKAYNNTLAAPGKNTDTFLLPMAFAEGSPMHPAYGAGHATVAGACVTVLKAYFDTSAILVQIDTTMKGKKGKTTSEIGFYTTEQIAMKTAPQDGKTFAVKYIKFQTEDDGNTLSVHQISCPLTLEGELNKLAANISIGRNMAGVHYFTDYYDSVRMGEEIAIGMLEEQALGYPTDPFVMAVPTFDGPVERIGVR
ncbi:MAG: vanadium-dependent haloperoxidase [Pseudomonadota bacterium]